MGCMSKQSRQSRPLWDFENRILRLKYLNEISFCPEQRRLP